MVRSSGIIKGRDLMELQVLIAVSHLCSAGLAMHVWRTCIVFIVYSTV